MDRGAWWATVHGVIKNWTQLSTHACINITTSQLRTRDWEAIRWFSHNHTANTCWKRAHIFRSVSLHSGAFSLSLSFIFFFFPSLAMAYFLEQQNMVYVVNSCRRHIIFTIRNKENELPMFVEDLIVYSSCLENPRDGGAWWVSVYEVAQSWTRSQQLSSSSSRILLPPLSFFGIHDSPFVYGKNLGSIETVTSWDTFLWAKASFTRATGVIS